MYFGMSFFFLLKVTVCVAQEQDWLTYYELSDFQETPRYNETIEYSKRLTAKNDNLSYQVFGQSPQGRALPLLVLSDSNINSDDKATVLIQACIHAGESDGKDAGLMLLRDMTIHKKYPDILKNVDLLFVPIFNVDGHEQFSKYNRINQNGLESDSSAIKSEPGLSERRCP